ncbi:aldo/keto reductase [Pelagibius litoralis]|uniref:Aldo/keto reductase n=1 Tax=Pelagibius litoralis TaxID=374515 RepID=A0A967EXR7_9PROT|nr:aldo/keto reductase [Pelagibius litoralis]NIA69371.1 aldo/keto reductase [Pelagibius litoralis]
MSIAYRRLRGTSLDVSVLCYGPMRLATTPSDPLLPVHERAMRAALDGGINFVHSSYEYGVRWLMNRVLSDHPARNDLHHVIKVPVPDWDDGAFDGRKYEMRIDEALKELCCEQIALVQWMWRIRPHDETHRLPLLARCIDGLRETHERLAQAGKVGELATFPYFPQSAAAAMMSSADFKCLIGYYNLLEVELSPVADMLEADGRSFLAIRPLYEGVLTDRYADHASVPHDHRLKAAKYAAAFEKRAALMKAFPEIAEQGLTKFALRFPLLSPNCASVIVGINTEEQVEQLLGMCSDVPPDPSLAGRVRAEAASLVNLT